MPPRSRKTSDAEPADTGPTPAEAAAGEVTDADVTMTFRGIDFVIPRKRAGSMQYRMALAAGDFVSVVFELLQHADSRRMLLTVDRDENPDVVAGEFLTEFSNAAGLGNSSASD